MAGEGKQPLLLANIRPLAKRGCLDLKEVTVALDVQMEDIKTDRSCGGRDTTDVARKEAVIKVGMGSQILKEQERTEKEKKKVKVKQGKKKMKLKLKEVKEKRKNLIEGAKVDPKINLVQKAKKRLFGDKIERKEEEKRKKTKKKKGKLEKRETKKGVHACNRCTKEFKFPTLLAEVSLILKIGMEKTASDNFQ